MAIIIVVSLVAVVFIIGILAAIAIPSFIRYQRRAASSEARFELQKMARGAIEHFHAAGLRSGAARPFPGSTEWAPAAAPCADGQKKYLPDPSRWQGETWKALQFEVVDPHFYRYRFISRGTGDRATFTVEAEGDLDCDGVRSRFRQVGRLTAGEVRLGPFEEENPYE